MLFQFLKNRRLLTTSAAACGYFLIHDHIAFCEEAQSQAVPKRKIFRIGQKQRIVLTKRFGKRLENHRIPQVKNAKRLITTWDMCASVSNRSSLARAWLHKDPSRIVTICKRMANVNEIAIGSSREVYCISKNNDVYIEQIFVPRDFRFEIEHLAHLKMKMIRCSSVHCAGVTADGGVVVWATAPDGMAHGQLGTKRSIDPYVLRRLRLPEEIGQITQIGVSDCHTIMVDRKGKLWGTGGNWVLSADLDFSAAPFEVLWEKGVKVAELAIGDDKILVRSQTGNVWVVGDAQDKSGGPFTPKVSTSLTRPGYTDCLRSAHSCACASGEKGIVCEGRCPLVTKDYEGKAIKLFDLAENTFISQVAGSDI